jgi:UDP-2,3-diacylglucosamine pyrophosphatase LpxH
MIKTAYKTIFLSDLHLGSNSSRPKEVLAFLKSVSCKTLFLNGDFIDGWALKKGGKWTKDHTKVIRYILKMTYKNKTKVIYIRGNHDDFLEHIIPFTFSNIEVKKDYVYESFDKKYYVVHGDYFDLITTKFKFLSVIGGWAYDVLIWVNKKYNHYREKRGKEYFSLSQMIKYKVKAAVSFMSDFENVLSQYAKTNHYDGIICGHIHHPEIKQIHGVQYMNSGDTVESMTCLAETLDGEWKILTVGAEKANQSIPFSPPKTESKPNKLAQMLGSILP